MKNISLAKAIVEVNGFERVVALKVDGEKMFGIVGNAKFVWTFKEHAYPCVFIATDKAKAAKYGRLYIEERLRMDGIKLDIFSFKKEVEYLHLEEENGVWCNCFINGYVRGEIDGVAFAWHPKSYKEAAAVDTAGFKGKIKKKVDTERIKARLWSAGFKCSEDFIKAIKSKNTDPLEISGCQQ